MPGEAKGTATSLHETSHLALRAACEIYQDAQKLRLATENRIRSATIDAELMLGHAEGIKRSEHLFGRYMRQTFRRSFPLLSAWQRETVGIGEHLLAQLIAHIGHPVNTVVHAWEGEGSDRTLVVVAEKQRRVSDLWSYCGHGDPSRKRKAGMGADAAMQLGRPAAKRLVYLIAESCCKCTGEHGRRRSPFRDVYDEGRAKYAERDWTPGHQHAAALRLTGKAFLKELWLVARDGEVRP